MSLMRRLVRWRFARDEGQEDIATPSDVHATFTLSYGDLVLGTLTLDHGTWEFQYSDSFKRQSDVKPLLDFPVKDKVYTSTELWPFFMARIPSISQPRIRTAIEEEGLDANSDVALLRRFGQRTIANPFILLELRGA